MNKAPALLFYPSDWLDIKVLRMSDDTQGIYIRLLCYMWKDSEDQCSIEDNDKTIAKVLGISLRKWKRARAEIQWKGDPILLENNGRLISKRFMKEKEKQTLISKKRTLAAKQSWEKRDANAYANADANACDLHMQNECFSFSYTNKENTSLSRSTKESEQNPTKNFLDRFTEDGNRKRKQALNVLHYLNDKAKRNYPDTYIGIETIIDRLNDGYTPDDLKHVINTKTHDPHFQKNRNLYAPEILFKFDKIQRYLTESPDDFNQAHDRPTTTTDDDWPCDFDPSKE